LKFNKFNILIFKYYYHNKLPVCYYHFNDDFYCYLCHFKRYFTANGRVSRIEAGIDIETRIGQTRTILNNLTKNTLTNRLTKGNLDKFQVDNIISAVMSTYGGERKEK
jgi:hypothetical protein